MALYTNCELFHCSMKRHDDLNAADEIATHLTVTKKPKYSPIMQDLNICELCPHSEYCHFNKKVKKLKIEAK